MSKEKPKMIVYKGKPCFQLCIRCPQDECGSEEKFWCHHECLTASFIDIEGFIICEKHIAKENCERFFIKECKFKCNNKNHGTKYSPFKKMSDFLMALSQAIRTLENASLVSDEMNMFIEVLHGNITKNWKRF